MVDNSKINRAILIKKNKEISFSKGQSISTAFKTQLKNLSKSQISYLEQSFGISRKTWNMIVAKKNEEYQNYKDNLTVEPVEIKKWFNQEKLKPEYFYLLNVSKCVSNEKINDFNKTLIQFYNRLKKDTKIGFPKFKKKGINDSFRIDNENFAIFHEKGKTYVELPKIKKRFLLSENLANLFDYEKVKLLNITFTKSKGQYFVSICFNHDKNFVVKNKQLVAKNHNKNKIKAIGIDVGITSFITSIDSNDNQVTIDTMKTLKKHLDKLKFYQSKFSKAKRTKNDETGKIVWSNNKKRYHLKIQRLHSKIANIRNDKLHKITTELCQSYDLIKIEDLKVKNMMKNHKLARVISESSFHRFKSMLLYKSVVYDAKVELVDTYYPSSKTCSQCQSINDRLTLKDRIWTCNQCNSVLDRDVNAAKNILNFNQVEFDKTKNKNKAKKVKITQVSV